MVRVAEQNETPVITQLTDQGDVILFDRRLIHSGPPTKQTGSTRHARVCHYIPYRSDNWDRDEPRISFHSRRQIKYTPHFL
jgi:hypothetical protein